MDRTIDCNVPFGNEWRDAKQGWQALLDLLLNRYIFPEIRADDNRIAEYIPEVAAADRRHS